LKQRRPNLEVEYVTAQQFAEDFVRALQSNRMEQFRRAHRNSGVWLVDDIQFIAGKDKTQEEVYHTFNALQQFGKQIVFTSDRLPKDLYGMDERLRSRFESGLVADVEMPNTETRCAIIRSKAEQDGIDLPFNVAFQLALNVPGNIRVLEGALTRLVATASLNQTPLSMEFTNEFVEKYYRTRQSRPSVSQIIEAVSKHYDIPASDIKGNSRKAPITLARHVAIFMTRRITQDSWNHIGSLFGDRDHTSVMHGYQRIDTMMQTNKDFAAIVNQLIRDVHPEC
jgi:chromosomal replication initiator protein